MDSDQGLRLCASVHIGGGLGRVICEVLQPQVLGCYLRLWGEMQGQQHTQGCK